MPARKSQSFRFRSFASLGSSEERFARYVVKLLDEMTENIERYRQEGVALDRFEPSGEEPVRDSGTER